MSGVSIGDLMFAGLMPGVLDHGAACWWPRTGRPCKYGYPRRADGSHRMSALPGLGRGAAHLHRAHCPGLMVIAIILVCVMEGIATATEAAAIAVTYSLVLTVFVYRTMTRRSSPSPGEGGEDHRRDPAADRRVEHAALPDGVPGDPGRDRAALLDGATSSPG